MNPTNRNARKDTPNKPHIPICTRVYFYLLFYVLGVMGCRTDLTISENRHLPKRPAFSLHKSDYSKNGLLDFNAIYYTVDEISGKSGRSRKAYNYYRFWPTGHVLADFSDHLPSCAEAEDFSYAYMGFYRLDDHTITIELFVPDTGQWKWEYGRHYGFIDEGSMSVTNSVLGTRDWPRRSIFTKYPIEGLMRKPDW